MSHNSPFSSYNQPRLSQPCKFIETNWRKCLNKKRVQLPQDSPLTNMAAVITLYILVAYFTETEDHKFLNRKSTNERQLLKNYCLKWLTTVLMEYKSTSFNSFEKGSKLLFPSLFTVCCLLKMAPYSFLFARALISKILRWRKLSNSTPKSRERSRSKMPLL